MEVEQNAARRYKETLLISYCRRWMEPFRLRHHNPEDFTSCIVLRYLYVLCVFRGIAATYLITWWLYNMSVCMQQGKMFIYFTNIFFTFICFYFVFGFNLSCIAIKQQQDKLRAQRQENQQPLRMSFDHSDDAEETRYDFIPLDDLSTSRSLPHSTSLEPCHSFSVRVIDERDDGNSINGQQSSSESPPRQTQNRLNICFQVYWFLFYISSNSCIILALGYWYDILQDNTSYYNSLTKHFISMVMVVMDFLISRIPVCLNHMIFPLVLTTLYNVFTLLYWAAGGTDPNGRDYIYGVMNYNHVTFNHVILQTLTVVLLQPLIHSGFLAASVFRNFVSSTLFRQGR